jgi:hypothetical protein
VFFLVFGSSAAGKTSALDALRDRVADLAIHDFDEVGVPSDADTAWRQEADERWVQRALDAQSQGTDFLLAGQTPLGELLATPSAVRLEAISACLVDCDDATRVARLHRALLSDSLVHDYLKWAEWLRHHARDPAWHQGVIRVEETEGLMQWSRWVDLEADDPRWNVEIVDTSSLQIDEVADRLAAWVTEERRAFAERR